MEANELIALLDGMDVPEFKKNSMDQLPWLIRNLGIRNSDHPNYEIVMRVMKVAIKN